MTKRDLVTLVANKLGMTQSDASRITEGAFETITKSLAEGRRWELRDFGVFEVRVRVSRIGRNPRTGDRVNLVFRGDLVDCLRLAQRGKRNTGFLGSAEHTTTLLAHDIPFLAGLGPQYAILCNCPENRAHLGNGAARPLWRYR
jgi:nucleoid DNA-binding protein